MSKAYRDPETGRFTDDRMRNAWYWAAQIRGWFEDGPNAGLSGKYYVTVLAGRPVVVFDKSWSEHNVGVIRDSLREYDFPADMTVRELEDEWRIFVEPNDDRLVSQFYDNWQEFEPESGFSDTE